MDRRGAEALDDHIRSADNAVQYRCMPLLKVDCSTVWSFGVFVEPKELVWCVSKR